MGQTPDEKQQKGNIQHDDMKYINIMGGKLGPKQKNGSRGHIRLH